MSFNKEQNGITGNIKISPALVIIYSLLGLATIVMSGMLFYFIYQIFQ